MAVVSKMGLTVTRTVNLGNMEFIKIEAAIEMHREEITDARGRGDTPEAMREDLMDEVRTLLDAATEEHVPRKSGR